MTAEVNTIITGGGGGTYYAKCQDGCMFKGPERKWTRHPGEVIAEESLTALSLAREDALQHNIEHHGAVRSPDQLAALIAQYAFSPSEAAEHIEHIRARTVTPPDLDVTVTVNIPGKTVKVRYRLPSHARPPMISHASAIADAALAPLNRRTNLDEFLDRPIEADGHSIIMRIEAKP